MPPPLITVHYLVALAGLYALFALIVVAMRAKHHVPFGDGGEDQLLRAVRVHGNFAEWVPLVVLVVGALEVLGANANRVHWLLGTLVAARVLHAIGLFSPLESRAYFIGRIFGAFGTWAVLTVATVLLALAL